MTHMGPGVHSETIAVSITRSERSGPMPRDEIGDKLDPLVEPLVKLSMHRTRGSSSTLYFDKLTVLFDG